MYSDNYIELYFFFLGKVLAKKEKVTTWKALSYKAHSLKPHFFTNVHRTLKGDF
jgi:hypothetical protein